MTTKGRYSGSNKKQATRAGAVLGNKWKSEFVGFVNFSPTVEDKERYITWAEGTDFWVALNAQTAKGRKITVSAMSDGEGCQAMCMERDVESVNAGLICSVRGEYAGEALTRLLFLISPEFPDDWKKKGVIKDAARW